MVPRMRHDEHRKEYRRELWELRHGALKFLKDILNSPGEYHSNTVMQAVKEFHRILAVEFKDGDETEPLTAIRVAITEDAGDEDIEAYL